MAKENLEKHMILCRIWSRAFVFHCAMICGNLSFTAHMTVHQLQSSPSKSLVPLWMWFSCRPESVNTDQNFIELNWRPLNGWLAKELC